ncbi:hypothetical protein D3C78_1491270 [compost metagenome]
MTTIYHRQAAVNGLDRTKVWVDEENDNLYFAIGMYVIRIRRVVTEEQDIPSSAIFAYLDHIRGLELKDDSVVTCSINRSMVEIHVDGKTFQTCLWPEVFMQIYG